MTSKLKTIDNSNFSLPTATSWIEYTRGDDVPPGTLLIACVRQGDEEYSEDNYTLCDFSEELKTFTDHDNRAIEAMGTVLRYHILHDESGQVIKV